MDDIMRVEMPLRASSKILSSYNTIKDLKKNYPKLCFVKYIYLDPVVKKLKGANPPDNLPLVADSYLTVSGKLEDIIKFSKDATEV